MCGIVGAIAERNITAILIEGLKRLEYRGYDSAGLAVINSQNQLQRLRVIGKVSNLESSLQDHPISGHCGIAHTRWATHGKPTEINAHPHQSGSHIAVVHNGIIENHESLRAELTAAGYKFETETDTEVVAHLINQEMSQGLNLLEAVKASVPRLEGAYAIVVLSAHEPGHLVAVRHGNPLVVGLGFGEHYLASDSLALLPVTQRFIYLSEGDIVDLHRTNFEIYDKQGQPVTRAVKTLDMSAEGSSRGQYRHYMQKEIFEQAAAVSSTLEGRLGDHHVLQEMFGSDAGAIFDKVQHVQIIACGTSYHAGMVARYWLENYAGVSCQVEVASEFRYRNKVVLPNTLFVAISQSGETADTLAALRQASELGYLASLVICNVPESSLVREANLVFMTRAGIEIGVASTKAFTTQLTALLLLTLTLGRRHRLSAEDEAKFCEEIRQLPSLIEVALSLNSTIETLSHRFADKQHALFLGRGELYPVALEGALKLKEISYIHAEAYPAGELKHGPLALVDKNMPVIAIAPNDHLIDKLKSNLQEVKARGGELMVFADSSTELKSESHFQVFKMPVVPLLLQAIVYAIPMQLLAYHVAIIKGTDVDQPRNLAKSVTVE
ncbi:MAG: glutamine--fructose-6-phosphate transaminase (isomerizing) [Legionellales bacterium]|nr:glutamine--fructose-6-phosphate transaminase (isomerizing) [Legionellales bacterium]